MIKTISRIKIILLISTCIILLASSLYAQTYSKQLADGVTLHQQVMGQNDSAAPQIINIVEVDPSRPGVKIKAIIAQDRVMATDPTKGRETISSIAKRLKAVAAVNADFFPFTGDMLNLHITDGELISEPMPDRAVFAITADGRYLIDTLGFDARVTLKDSRWIAIKGINRPRGKNEIVAYTQRYSPSAMTSEPGVEVVVKLDNPIRVGRLISGVVSEINTSAVNTAIPEGSVVLSGSGQSGTPLMNWLQPGDRINMEFTLIPAHSDTWDNVTEAVGGSPCLIRNGAINYGFDEKSIGTAFATTLHPRTAIGVTRDGKVLFVTVDGRQTISSGIQLKNLADLLMSKGCVIAMNLDGGGSTTLATPYGVLNSPSEGIERPVANALAVTANTVVSDETQPQYTINPLCGNLKSGSSMQFTIANVDGTAIDQTISDKIIWTTTGGAGFVDQSGKFYGIKSRKGNIIATLGSVSVSVPVEVVPGPPFKLNVKLDPDSAGDSNRSILTVSVIDANLNAINGMLVNIKVTGGTADLVNLVTNSKSKTQTGIKWDDTAGVKTFVEVSINGLQPQILNRNDK